jgi:hypothetical protein
MRKTKASRQLSAALGRVKIVPFADPIERFLAAADVVITKGTRGITHDAASVGVPSISLSHGHNPIDDLLIPRITNNRALNTRAVTPEILRDYILQRARHHATSPLETDENVPSALEQVAEQISHLLHETPAYV